MTFNDLMQLIEDKPVSGAPAARRHRKGVRARLHESAAACFALAQRLAKSPADLETFYDLGFWEGGYKKNPDHLLKHVCQFVADDRTGSDAKTAEDQARDMQPFYDARKTPEQVLAALNAVGFDGLREHADVAKPRIGDERPDNDEGEGIAPRRRMPRGDEGNENGPGARRPGPQPKRVGNDRGREVRGEPSLTIMPRAKIFEHILSEVDADAFEATMALEVDGEIGWILKRLPDSDVYRADNSEKPMKRYRASAFELT